jgi:hypothetical protein
VFKLARGIEGAGIDHVLELARKLEEVAIVDPTLRELQFALTAA